MGSCSSAFGTNFAVENSTIKQGEFYAGRRDRADRRP